MNIVFWLLVIIVMVLVWFCLSFAFKGIGGVGLKLYNDAKKEIEGDEPKKSTECDVVRIAAEAEASANRQIAASLTPELIEKIKYEQWNGQTPKVTSSGGSIIDIGGLG